ncbi:GNAT family N-acetyltransferase [Micromonospora aurantiaca (nom. illeg.)]|uniref:GNAT family N-acetyltransferase n=1 Tax=Micromonospora aurantiaca (nom. illeg.) TaxID=47850 RepID=UPI0033CC29E9
MCIASLGGEITGACVTVVDGGFGSHYCVVTLPAFHSRGVGRALMLAPLAPLADLPLTLTASRLGTALYESLGFIATSTSAWWSSRSKSRRAGRRAAPGTPGLGPTWRGAVRRRW